MMLTILVLLMLNELVLPVTCWFPDDIWAIDYYPNPFVVCEMVRDRLQ